MVARALRARPLGASRWARANWLVVAPHADDEVLGCGALIADAATRGRLAAIVFLTDSAGSHPCETVAERLRLAALRRAEARAAIRKLAPRAPPPIFLDWPDAAPHPHGSQPFDGTANHLAKLCNRLVVDAIAVTGRDEPHCDHVAAFQIAREAARRAARPTRLFEYIVWSKALPGPEFEAVTTRPIDAGRRKAALAQHRSQMTPLAGDGFRVPQTMRAMPACDLLYTRR